MTGKTVDLDRFLVEDQLGCNIANLYQTWDTLRQVKKQDWLEVSKYVYAVDTTTTTNSKLPWKNKTTIPKLCQIRDNLYANYMAALFPKRKWTYWEGDDSQSEVKQKKEAIEAYMSDAVEKSGFKQTVGRLLQDYIDRGTCFAYPDWQDETIERPDKTQVGYVGPTARVISPLDIVFNPTAPSFAESPKIIRALVSIGEVKDELEKLSTEETREELTSLYNYLMSIRTSAADFVGDNSHKNSMYQMEGFTSYIAYLQSGYCEVLTFYGNIFDMETGEYLKNYVIKVVDRHKVFLKVANPSFFGKDNICRAGWRERQDNLWAMGPLDNLIGMQYRIDHIENLKADVFDLITFPPLKIKGYVEDFEWKPFSRIYVGDDGDVEMLVPDYNVLNANLEIASLEQKMEEMAGAPKEAMGFRTPGEKTMYEVQRLENAAARIFQSKIVQFEETILEPLLQGMLELARRKIGPTTIRVFDDEMKAANFLSLTGADITGNGRIRPLGARHFAEQAETIQNLTNFANSALGQNPAIMQHWSGIALSTMIEDVLNFKPWKLVQPYIAISEAADAQRLTNAHTESVQMEAGTPSGLTGDDTTQPQQ